MISLKGRRVLIAGLAKSGAAAAAAAVKMGAEVWGYDDKTADEIGRAGLDVFASAPKRNVRLFLNGETPAADEKWDYLILSPGVPPDARIVSDARRNGALVMGELEFAWRAGRANFLAVTGTNGKTTTTSLIGEMFKNAGMRAEIAGNIGIPAVSKALLEDMDENSWMVTETSSFQLETIVDFHPKVSVLLNITPDHMDRHKTMLNYAAAKARIFENQDENDFFIVNRGEVLSWILAKGCAAQVRPFSRTRELGVGAFVRDGRIVLSDRKDETILCGVDELIIPGAHNLENALAAAAAADSAGAPREAIAETLKTFKGVEHRLEFAGTVGGVRFVNDSKGTNPEASIKAIEAIEGGICLIAGGYDKNASFESFANALCGKVKKLALMGRTAEKIASAALKSGFAEERIVICRDMEACVREGFEAAEPGDTVLLSPACASWDMYACFEERGEDFKTCVEELKRYAG
ncbi:MAG: UDP-N-acetylmuramoyl-L-alanine--D-glutamate ligase [Clostridiales Family XIII bacterium]|jgi:UDP-N-acetylmuramoylalanine--D-glutamate ligase|nr:UDP-N-acetylmuramoyl-L-alanine--D-glutamate ligase [Clostridiales Family XIII bacterium]